MKGVKTFEIWVLVFAMLGAAAGALCCQQSDKAPSLGNVARRLQEERAKQKRLPVPVYTNDSLRTLPAPQTQPKEASAPAKAAEPSKATAAPSSKQPKEYGEEYFRTKAGAIRSRLELHERQLAALEEEWGLRSTEYYPDPQKTLQEESTPTFHADLNKLRAKIAETQQQITDDQKAMDDLREELRRKGGDAGWIRE
jgi:hypothetical protein